MSIRDPRRLAPILGVLAVLAAGCGEGDRARPPAETPTDRAEASASERDGYIAATTQALETLQRGLRRANPSQAETPEEAADAFAAVRDTLRETGRRLGRVAAPADVAEAHRDFARAFVEIADGERFERLIAALRAGDVAAAREASRASIVSARTRARMAGAREELAAKGYEFPGFEGITAG
jgi:hypothetical protein